MTQLVAVDHRQKGLVASAVVASAFAAVAFLTIVSSAAVQNYSFQLTGSEYCC